MSDLRRRYLKPQDVVAVMGEAGVQLSIATLATWRTRCPERLPFVKLVNRVYYPVEAVERFLSAPEARG